MHKFFVEESQIQDGNIFISGKDVKHLRDVLRLNIGDQIEVACKGYNYKSSINKISKDSIKVDIMSKEKGLSEAKIHINLYQALAKGSKMDLIIQKNTEIGVKNFVGIITNRTIVKIKDIKKENSKISRWNLIAEEAAKQSKRDYIPKFIGIQSFEEMLNVLKDEKNIIVAYEDEEYQSIGNGLNMIEGKTVNLLIGPEGGFEKEEIEKLKLIGAKTVSLGKRILRTETAGFVASTIILYELGELGVI